MTSGIVFGVATRTGAAVAVALSGPAAAPLFRARTEMVLLPAGPPAGLPAQPYHAAAVMTAPDAELMIERVEVAAEQAAAAGLRALAGLLSGTPVLGVAVVVKPVSVPARLTDILRSHAWMHAAEGQLYRQAVLAAAAESGWTARAVEQSALPAAEQLLGELGRAAGRPWRRMEKDAARAALTMLAG